MLATSDSGFHIKVKEGLLIWLLLKHGPRPWTRVLKNLDPEKLGWLLLKPGPGPWTQTLINLDPEKRGKQLDVEQ